MTQEDCFGEPHHFEYDLGRAHKSFAATVGMSDFSVSELRSLVEFWVDGLVRHLHAYLSAIRHRWSSRLIQP